METINYQEIFISANSDYFSREFFMDKRAAEYKNLLPKEQLAEACWNGILNEILPEITSHLHLSQINGGNRFLNVCLGNENDDCNTAFSINPYFFLTHFRKN